MSIAETKEHLGTDFPVRNHGHVDAHQGGLSIGMTSPESSALVARLGCEYAINLDGGGSSAVWLGGRVMNRPSDGQERKVANSLILVATQ